MRRGRRLLLALALAAFAAAPASAASVTVLLSGTWSFVDDTAGVTDGSITPGGSFTVTLTYDDATADSDPDPTSGGYLLSAATSDLTLSTGSYTFSLPATEGVVFGIGDSFFPGQDDFGWFAENFTTSGPLPLGVGTGYGYMNPFAYDTTETAHSSDALTDLPWDASAYDSSDEMYFLIAVTGAGAGQQLELIGDFTDFAVLPEPSLAGLAVAGAAALLLAARRLRG